MSTLLIWSSLALLVVLVMFFWVIPAKMRRDARKFDLIKELHGAINQRSADFANALAEFKNESENALKILKTAKYMEYIKNIGRLVQTATDMEEKVLRGLLNTKGLNIKEIGVNIADTQGTGWAYTIRNHTQRIKDLVASYEKNLQEAWSWIAVASQHLGTYVLELGDYTSQGYELGPDRHFAESEAMIREAEKIMSGDERDPEKAIELCKKASEIAGNFVERINRWVITHDSCKILLEKMRNQEHLLRQKYEMVSKELKLQTETPASVLVLVEGVPDHLSIASKKRFEAMDLMDMKIQNFEKAWVLLEEVEQELAKIEEILNKPVP